MISSIRRTIAAALALACCLGAAILPSRAASTAITYDTTTKLVVMPTAFWTSNVVAATGYTPTNSAGRLALILDANLLDLVDGSLTGSKVGSGINGDNITTGTVADARIDSAIARDSEVTAAIAALSTVYQPLDADLTDLADGSLSGSKVGSGINGDNITTGTVADARIDSAIARDSEVTAAIAALSTVYQPLDADLTDLADGSLSGSKVGSGINGDNITTGTVADARIAATVARLASPAFTGSPTAPTAADGTSNTVVATTAWVLRNAGTGGGGGTGNANTNASTAWADSTSVSFYDLEIRGSASIANLSIGSASFAGVWGFANGGHGATNASQARTNLGVVPDVDVQTFRLPLLQFYVALAADGDMPYRNASGIVTNVTSTSAGRTLLAAVNAAAQRTAMGVPALAGDTFTGPVLVPYEAYSSTWTNSSKTNEVPTKRAVAEKIEALSVGAYISSVDTNHEVVGSQLRLTNFVSGATGPIARKSDLDALSSSSTNTTIVDVLTNATGTWSKPTGARAIRIIAFGGGGGGGGGAKGTNVSFAGGGGGGSGAAMVDWTFHADEIASSVSYTNGIGGAGGSSQTTNDTVGLTASNGGNTLFGGYVFAAGGTGGQGGTNTGSSSQAAAATAMFAGSNGGAGGVVSSPGAGATISGRPGGSGGGGGGGSIRPASGSTTTNAGAASGVIYTATVLSAVAGGDLTTHPNGYDGAGWTISQSIIPRGATGGGGGTAGSSGIGSGGQGGWPGGGGGGGSGSLNAGNSGSGGKGGNGVIVVITHR